MLRKTLLATAVLSAGLIGYGVVAPASAATASLGGALPNLEKQTASNIELVQSRKWKKRQWAYNRNRQGQRFRYRHGNNRHYYGGYWYRRPWWNYGGPTIALGIGSGYGYGGAYAFGGGNSHVQWCLNRYRSYDPRSDTFMGYDGYRHRCDSPFGGY